MRIHQYEGRKKSPCNAKAIEQSEEGDLMAKNLTGLTSGATPTEQSIQPTQLSEAQRGAANDALNLNQPGCCNQNSLIVYQRVFRASQCPSSSRKLGPNFPRMWKERRMTRRKSTMYEIIKLVIAAEDMQKTRKKGTIRRQKATNLGSNRSAKSAKQAQKVEVDIDQETMRVWKLRMGEVVQEERDEKKKRWWDQQRNIIRGRVDRFIACMRLVQGDRRFSPWKGSVVDSVVGAFLTQNVSDHLSSSAFMSLAAKYPIRSTIEHKSMDDVGDIRENLGCMESFGSEAVVQNKITPRAQEATVELCASLSNCQVLPSSQEEVNKAKGQESSKINRKGSKISPQTKSPSRKKKSKVVEKHEKPIDWDDLRKNYIGCTTTTSDTMDTVDWEEVRQATVDEVADAIKVRGQHHRLAERIKDFLNRVVRDHGSINLEWLRYVPPDKSKEYLLSYRGLGLKSVECVRLLALKHCAFPVDTNVGRAALRLGWVPLKPHLESPQIHLLEQYPALDAIQMYLWPRLCTLDQQTLYELHYHMITFGKVFCGRRNPNCNACPMRGDCRHFSSEFASATPALPGPQEKHTMTSIVPDEVVQNSSLVVASATKSLPAATFSESRYQTKSCESVIEYLERDIEDLFPGDNIPTIQDSTEYLERDIEDLFTNRGDYIATIPEFAEYLERDIEDLFTNRGDYIATIPEFAEYLERDIEDLFTNRADYIATIPEFAEYLERDIEDLFTDRGDYIATIPKSSEYLESEIEDMFNGPRGNVPTIRQDVEEFRKRAFIGMNNIALEQVDMLNALVSLSLAASIPLSTLKGMSRLRTTHHVYVLPDSHHMLAGFHKREPDDPSPYLLDIWTSDECLSGGTAISSKPRRKLCDSSHESHLCNGDTCSSCNAQTIRGTILIPYQTATNRRFPLNGTYFQVKEVFADDETSQHPLAVPREWIGSLERRTLHCGAYAGAIFSGLSTQEIQSCFSGGFVCVRAFNRTTRAPAHLAKRFHVSTILRGQRKVHSR